MNHLANCSLFFILSVTSCERAASRPSCRVGWGPLDGTGVPISQLWEDLFLTLGCKAGVVTVLLLHLPDSNKGDFEGPASSVGKCIRIKVHSTGVKYTVFCHTVVP